MAREKVVGAGLLVASAAGILLYVWLLFFSAWSLLTLQVTATAAVAAVLGLLGWIGYAIATTPPPAAFVPPPEEPSAKPP